MPTSAIALQILILLLPGFATVSVVRSLATRVKQSDFGQVVDACLFSLIVYAIYFALNGGSMPFTVDRLSPTSTDFVTHWNAWSLARLALITAAVSVMAAIYINHDGNRLLHRLRITEKSTRQSIWIDVFESVAQRRQIVQVELAGERSVIGILSYYSDEAEDCSLYLRDAAWVSQDGAETPILGDGILLTKNSGIKSISLLDPTA